jgi:hypothetical protein
VLAGGKVYWPTVQAIHVFDQRTGQEQAPVMLEARGIHSGNLVAAGEVLVIASSDRLTALGPADYSAAGNTLGQGERAKPRTEQATRAPAPSGRTRPASQSASGR